LVKEDQARRDLEEFDTRAGKARFLLANSDQVSETSPYFDPREGEREAMGAIALTEQWGPTVEDLPLEDRREPTKKDIYELLLLVGQNKLQLSDDKDAAKETLKLLEQAAQLREEKARTSGYHRLRAAALKRLGEDAEAAKAQKLADAPDTPTAAQDH